MPQSPREFLFLLSSARPGGNSEALARRAATTLTCSCVWTNLAALSLPPFQDIRPAAPAPATGDLARVWTQMQAASDIVFVAPIYWYALPSPAKLLLDHWSGFLDAPDLGFAAQMAGKTLWLITARADPAPDVPATTEAAMVRTAAWLTMRWGGALHGVGDAPGEIASCPAWAQAPGFLTR